MAQTKIVGYKNMFGFVLSDWVDESIIRTIVMFLLSAVVMLFVLILVIWPKLGDVDSLKTTLKKDQDGLVALKNSQTGLNNLSQQIPDATQNVILSAIPQTYSPENAIFLLRKIGDATGVSIVSYKLPSGTLFEDATSAKTVPGSTSDSLVNFISFPITLTVSAPVDSLLSFINKVESALPFGIVSDLNMQEVTKLTKTTSSAVSMDLQISYYQAILKKVDISKINTISNEDLTLVKTLSGFSTFAAPLVTNTQPAIATGSGNLFGF